MLVHMYLCYFMVMHVLMLGCVTQLINWKMWPFYGHLTWIYWHVSVHQQVNPRLLTRFCRCIVFICRINWLIIALMKILMLFPEGLFSWICFFFLLSWSSRRKWGTCILNVFKTCNLSKKFVEVLTWRPIREKRTERGNIENLQGHCT